MQYGSMLNFRKIKLQSAARDWRKIFQTEIWTEWQRNTIFSQNKSMENPQTIAYIQNLPEERREDFLKIFDTISANISAGYAAGFSYGMPCWCVPLQDYPAGYHCAPDTPLPFISLACQKNFIALYHMGIYADPALHDWFTAEYAQKISKKPDMGKSCIRFKKSQDIPLELIGQLVQKMPPREWIALYEEKFRRK